MVGWLARLGHLSAGIAVAAFVGWGAGGCGDADDGSGGGGPGDDRGPTAAETEFDRVDKSGGTYHLRSQSDGETLRAVVDGSTSCASPQGATGESPPRLRIRTAGVEPGTYAIHSSIFEARDDAAIVRLEELGGDGDYSFPAVGGTVELEGNAGGVASSVDVSIRAVFPAPLLGESICESSVSNRADGGRGEVTTTCDCKRYAPREETFTCSPKGRESVCCVTDRQYGETVTVETNVSLAKCEDPMASGSGATTEGG